MDKSVDSNYFYVILLAIFAQKILYKHSIMLYAHKATYRFNQTLLYDILLYSYIMDTTFFKRNFGIL